MRRRDFIKVTGGMIFVPKATLHAVQGYAAGAYELLSMRNIGRKVFSLGYGKRKALHKIGVQHMPSDFSAWRQGRPVNFVDVMPAWVQQPQDYVSTGCWYTAKVAADMSRIQYWSKATDRWIDVRIERIGSKEYPTAEFPEIDGDILRFRDVDLDYDIEIRLAPAKLRIFKILKSERAPRKIDFIFDVHNEGSAHVREKAYGRDSDHMPTEVRRVITSLSSTRSRLEETWTGNVVTIDPITRIAGLSDKPKYPVEIDADIDEVVVGSNNDGTIDDASPPTDRVNNYRGGYFSTQVDRGPTGRFTTVAVPNGATIDDAYWRLNSYVYPGNGTDATLWGEDSDDAQEFNADTYYYVTPTTASTNQVNWPVKNTWINIDVQAQVEEIVARAGWSSNNAMRMFGFVTYADGGGARWYSIEKAVAAYYMQLDINYTVAGGTSIPVLMQQFKRRRQ